MNKIVVITGGTSGIGLELKKLFISQKDTVITISTRTNNDPFHYSCSVSDEEEVTNIIDQIGQKFGQIDILINNAGFGMSAITEIAPMSKIKDVVDVNYYGLLYVTRASLKYMTTGAKIVNISSAMALFPVPFRSIYGSIKSAVLTLSYALRMELKPLGINVVVICPGDIKTNFTKNRIKDFESSEKYGNRLRSATEKSDAREEKRIPANKCAKAIWKKICKNKTRPMYIIGAKYKLLYFISRITPKSWLLNITAKLFGGKF